MKRQIRRGVFETNSSSTHSISIVSQEEYDLWKKGNLYFDGYKSFYSEEEALKSLRDSKYHENLDYSDKYAVDSALRDEDLKTYSEFWDNDELEGYSESFTTKSGDNVIAFGMYGND